MPVEGAKGLFFFLPRAARHHDLGGVGRPNLPRLARVGGAGEDPFHAGIAVDVRGGDAGAGKGRRGLIVLHADRVDSFQRAGVLGVALDGAAAKAWTGMPSRRQATRRLGQRSYLARAKARIGTWLSQVFHVHGKSSGRTARRSPSRQPSGFLDWSGCQAEGE